jgi:hypothetical protein
LYASFFPAQVLCLSDLYVCLFSLHRYYASQIFRNAGFAAGKEAAGVSLLLGIFKLGATFVAVAR